MQLFEIFTLKVLFFLDLREWFKAYLVVVNFGTPAHYWDLQKVRQKVHELATNKTKYRLLYQICNSCQSYWQLVTAVNTVDIFYSWYKLQHLWELLQGVDSFKSCYKLATDLTAVTDCRQFLQLLQAVDSFDTC